MKCSECRASKEMRGGVCLAGIIPYYLKNGAKGCACNSQQIEKYIRDFNPVKTHFDEIKSMSAGEFAKWVADILNHCENKKPEELCRMSCPLYKCCNDQPSDNIEDWLKAPADKEETE